MGDHGVLGPSDRHEGPSEIGRIAWTTALALSVSSALRVVPTCRRLLSACSRPSGWSGAQTCQKTARLRHPAAPSWVSGTLKGKRLTYRPPVNLERGEPDAATRACIRRHRG